VIRIADSCLNFPSCRLEGECQELRARVAVLESSNSDVASFRKDLRQMEKKLEQSKEEVLKLTSDLEAARTDAKKKSVLSLEMADCEVRPHFSSTDKSTRINILNWFFFCDNRGLLLI